MSPDKGSFPTEPYKISLFKFIVVFFLGENSALLPTVTLSDFNILGLIPKSNILSVEKH